MRKLIIIGHGRHGKDTVAEWLALKYGMKFESSSYHLAKSICYPALKDKYNYKSPKECFDDRSNHRGEWYNLIAAYCDKDPAILGKEIFSESDVYCGIRSKREFNAVKASNLCDFTIWVDRSDHLPPEPADSNELDASVADFVIDNNGTLDQLCENIDDLMSFLLWSTHSLTVCPTDLKIDSQYVPQT